jgi:hypothetical protein
MGFGSGHGAYIRGQSSSKGLSGNSQEPPHDLLGCYTCLIGFVPFWHKPIGYKPGVADGSALRVELLRKCCGNHVISHSYLG